MKTIVTVLFLLFAGRFFAQTAPVPGTFGGNGTNGPKLELKADQSFSYTDLTRPNKPVVFTGTWSFNDGKLLLTCPSSCKRNAMTAFRVGDDGKCLKARKKFAFYRLCNC